MGRKWIFGGDTQLPSFVLPGKGLSGAAPMWAMEELEAHPPTFQQAPLSPGSLQTVLGILSRENPAGLWTQRAASLGLGF